MAKMCELCKIRPATIPDRNRMDRPISRVCSDCHAARLRGDFIKVVSVHNKKLNADASLRQPGEGYGNCNCGTEGCCQCNPW